MKRARRVLGSAAAAAFAAAVSPATAGAPASADPCPDVEVVFARGTFEPPGIGATGEAFVDALRSKLGGKSVDVYAVDYPASLDFATASLGVIDASNKVQSVAAACPDTTMVLGGYSQGAAVAGYITADSVPAGYVLPSGITGPMPADIADHVAAVTLFGKPSNGFLQTIANTAPPVTVGSHYAAKTIDVCIPEDPICSPAGSDNGAHTLYAVNGMADQAADLVARSVTSSASTSR